MHDEMIKQVHQRHTDNEPVKRISQNHAHFTALHQPADNHHFNSHGENIVRVIPEDIGVSGNYCGGCNAATTAEKLENQHGEDTAEDKVDIKEN